MSTKASPLCWFHTQVWLKGHWLHGDPRGFRDYEHRVHSSGDYKHRPPADEHVGLSIHMQRKRRQPKVTLNPDQRQRACEHIVRWFEMRAYPLVAISVNGAHTHVVAKLPSDDPVATLGWMKKYVSQAMSRDDAALAGGLYAARGEPKLLKDMEHLVRSHGYVLDHHLEGAAVWGVAAEDLEKYWRGQLG